MSLQSVAELINNIRSPNPQLRLNSIKSITRISQTIGQQRSRDEFIPFLTDCAEDDDNIVLELIQQLPKLVPLIGGQNYVDIFFKKGMIQLLCEADSKIVREEAIKLAIQFSEYTEQTKEEFRKLTLNLMKTEFYNTLQSGIELSSTYLKITYDKQQRQQLFQYITILSKDVLPPVRRQLSSELPNILEQLSQDEVTTIYPIAKTLLQDPIDTIRAISIKFLPLLLQKSRNVELIQLFIQKLSTEISWRSRYSCCDQIVSFVEVCKGLPISKQFTAPRDELDVYTSLEQSQIEPNCLIPNMKPINSPLTLNEQQVAELYSNFLSDSEQEVRCIAIQRLIKMLLLINQTCTENIVIPALLKQSSIDDSVYVKLQLATYACKIQFKEEVKVQILQNLLQDKSSQVKAETIRQLAQNQFPQELLDKCITAILVLINDQNWRIRQKILISLPQFSKKIPEKVFSDKLIYQVFALLSDQIFHVRVQAADSISLIGSIYGSQWCQQWLRPQLIDQMNKTSYLYRVNCLYLSSQLIQLKCGIQDVCEEIIKKGLNDKVINVRYTAVEAVINCQQLINQELKQTVKKMAKDDVSDDVREIASKI